MSYDKVANYNYMTHKTSKQGIIIGIDASRAFVDDPAGPEFYSLNLIKSLAKIDRNNSYILYLRPGQKVSFNLPENFTAKQIQFPRLWTQIGLAAEIFRHKPDVLFIPAHTLPLLAHFGFPQLPIVVTVHGLEGKFLPQSGNKLSHFYRNWSIGWAIRYATHLIAVSEDTRTDVVNTYHISTERIEVVHEGVDIEKFKNQNSKGKSFNKAKYYMTRNNSFDLLPDGEVYRVQAEEVLSQIIAKFRNVSPNFEKEKVSGFDYILFVGTVQPRKNLTRLLTAYSILVKQSEGKVPHLIIAGKLGWTYKNILNTYKKNKLQQYCTFLGRVEDEVLVALYKGAKAFVLPSITEGFGLPVLEAQAAGVPVIVSKAGALPEVAGDGAVYVNPLSVDDIKDKIAQVLREKSLRHDLITRGYKNVNNFSWDTTARSTLKILEKAATK